MKIDGVLVRCMRKGKANVCKANEVHGMTPWELVKSVSKCKVLSQRDGGTCKLAVAYEQKSHEVVRPSTMKFNY